MTLRKVIFLKHSELIINTFNTKKLYSQIPATKNTIFNLQTRCLQTKSKKISR